MAVQAARKKAVSAVPKGGAGRSALGKKPEKVWDYTQFRIRINAFDEFQTFLAGYPDKTGLMLYVYRLDPRLDFNLIGRRETNIDEISNVEDMTAKFICDKYQRGRYMVKLTDANRKRPENEVCQSYIKNDSDPRPPVYDVRTLLLGFPGNLDEINRQLQAGALIRDHMGIPRLRVEGDPLPGAPPVAQPAPAAPAVSPILGNDLVATILLKALDRGAQSPHDSVRDTIEMAKQLQQPPINVEALIERVAERLGGGKREDLFSSWERMEAFLARARPVAGIVEAADAPVIRASNGEGMMRALPDVLREGTSFVGELMKAWIFFKGPMAPRPAAAGPQPVPRNGGAPNVQQMPQQQQPAPQLTFDQCLEQVVTQGMEQMEAGVDGYDYAAWVCIHLPGGADVFRWLESKGGVEGLVALMAISPLTRDIVRAPGKKEQIEQFLGQFFSFEANESAPGSASAPAASSV